MSVEEIFDRFERLLREIADKVASTEIIIVSTPSGHLISYYSKRQVTEDFVTDVAALIGSIGEGLKVIFEQLEMERGVEELVLAETPKHILLLVPLEKASIALKVEKPTLLGAIRAVIKSYIPRIAKLLDRLEEAQIKAIKEELAKEVAPIRVQQAMT